MTFSQLIADRYSVRAYQSTPVEEEKIAQILEAARLAPTAANRQPFKFIVVHTRGKETSLQPIHHREWFLQAPILICACILPKQAWTRSDGAHYALVDVAIAIDHLVLAATELGLGTCWMSSFNQQAARDVFQIPLEAEPVVIIPVGYPAEGPGEKERKSISELISYETW